jgi:hypothetical protein
MSLQRREGAFGRDCPWATPLAHAQLIGFNAQ